MLMLYKCTMYIKWANGDNSLINLPELLSLKDNVVNELNQLMLTEYLKHIGYVPSPSFSSLLQSPQKLEICRS